MDILFTYIDKVVKMIEKFIDELSKSPLLSDEMIIALIVLMIIILVALLILFSKRKNGTKSASATSKIKTKAQDTSKQDDNKKFTLQFKKSVANLDLDLSDQTNAESIQLTASQKRELTLNLKALKELLDGKYINQHQFNLKEKELKAAYA